MNFLQKTSQYILPIVMGAILLLAFALRVINLNYNSPFNDEAIYVVLGRLGIFQGDWWTYNAAGWMAGQPYVYPPLTAISYALGGILGSRFLNVVLGVLAVEAVFVFTYLIPSNLKQKEKKVAALIAATIIAVSTAALYVSRLATYDLPSFYLFLLGLIFLLYAQMPGKNHGKYYFLAFIFVVFSFFTKITIGIYLPFIYVYSFLTARKQGGEHWRYWKRYFGIPFVFALVAYGVFNMANLKTYFLSQVARDKNPFPVVFKTFWDNTRYVWIMWAFTSVWLFIEKQGKLWFAMSTMAILVFIFHIVTQREPTLDKHTFLTLMFLAPLVGIGFMEYLRILPTKLTVRTAAISFAIILLVYGAVSYKELRRFNILWHNSDVVTEYLSHNVHPGDHVLAEVGASAILASYDKNFPPYTVTFDWFEYKQTNGEQAYVNALRDGFFDYIELDGGDQTSEQFHSKLHNLVLANVAGNYKLDYANGGYLIYRRAF